jgi:hypothetical protein
MNQRDQIDQTNQIDQRNQRGAKPIEMLVAPVHTRRD